MNYNNVKLGLIDRFKVWQERRKAEAQRDGYYKEEGELIEVDYSEADKMKHKLLHQKRVRKATKDASRLYKKYSDGLSEADFIEQYLIESGLKKRESPKFHKKNRDFISKYPKQKSEEEKAYEQAHLENKMYYKIGNVEYEVPGNFSRYYRNRLPLQKIGTGKFLILDEKMNPRHRCEMLKRLTSMSLDFIAALMPYLYEGKNDPANPTKQDVFTKLCSKAAFIDYQVNNNIIPKGSYDVANSKLINMVEEIFKFREKLKEDHDQNLGR